MIPGGPKNRQGKDQLANNLAARYTSLNKLISKDHVLRCYNPEDERLEDNHGGLVMIQIIFLSKSVMPVGFSR